MPTGADIVIKIDGKKLIPIPQVAEHVVTCYVVESDEHKGFWEAEINSNTYGFIHCLARDPIRAQGFAWRELGERMIKRTQTIAYKATHNHE